MRRVAISGAGLAGTLLAIYLARRGYEVDLFERRPDPRGDRIDFGRSINLALSARGSHALDRVGLLEAVLAKAVPMRARAIHSVQGSVAYQPFGRHEDEYLSAIERHTLNMLLLDAAEGYDGVHVHFERRLTDLEPSTMTLTLEDRRSGTSEHRTCDRLIVAEGAFSPMRGLLVERGLVAFVQDELAYGYKELPISIDQAEGMKRECLHLWPRRSFLMIANPNPDDSFSCTLFMPHDQGDVSFAKVRTPEDVVALFEKFFPDALARMPTLAEDYFARPTGTLPTVRGGPWYVDDKILLLGDAAHALTPFFAQGMNSAFEDCEVFLECLERAGDRWDEALPDFYRARRANTDAVADMAMQNYREIQDFIADSGFLLRKHVERELMIRYPDQYVSMHVMVMFTRAPYSIAHACGALQSTLLDAICDGALDADSIDWARAEVLLERYAADVRLLTASSAVEHEPS